MNGTIKRPQTTAENTYPKTFGRISNREMDSGTKNSSNKSMLLPQVDLPCFMTNNMITRQICLLINC